MKHNDQQREQEQPGPKEKEAAMIEVYLQEVLMRERLANARRDAALYEARRQREARRASPWRDAIHRVSRAISSLRLKRRKERMAHQ